MNAAAPIPPTMDNFPLTLTEQTGLSAEELGPLANAPTHLAGYVSDEQSKRIERQDPVWWNRKMENPQLVPPEPSTEDVDRRTVSITTEHILKATLPVSKAQMWEENIQPIIERYSNDGRAGERVGITLAWWARILDDKSLALYLSTKYNVQQRLYKALQKMESNTDYGPGAVVVDIKTFAPMLLQPCSEKGIKCTPISELAERRRIAEEEREQTKLTVEHAPTTPWYKTIWNGITSYFR